jgi:hypothetical protein
MLLKENESETPSRKPPFSLQRKLPAINHSNHYKTSKPRHMYEAEVSSVQKALNTSPDRNGAIRHPLQVKQKPTQGASFHRLFCTFSTLSTQTTLAQADPAGHHARQDRGSSNPAPLASIIRHWRDHSTDLRHGTRYSGLECLTLRSGSG